MANKKHTLENGKGRAQRTSKVVGSSNGRYAKTSSASVLTQDARGAADEKAKKRKALTLDAFNAVYESHKKDR